MNIHTSETQYLKTEVQRLSALVRAQQITIDKLEQALAQPKQEPVAWITKTGNVWKTKADETDTPLYTTPPQRTWVGLTEEERADCWNEQDNYPQFAASVEAKLKEKNT